MALSQRAQKAANPDVTQSVLANNWHPTSNPDGYVSLGVAENSLMHSVLSEHLHKNIALPDVALTYGDFYLRGRTSVASFLNKQLKPVLPIDPAHIMMVNGCTSGVEQLAWCVGNPGDLILLGRPYYGAFPEDITLRTGTKLALVSFQDEDPLGLGCVKRYEETILEAQARGDRVAALVLCNPHNPLGRCYAKEIIVELMKLCQRYKIHLLSDEIYALSIFKNTVDSSPPPAPFESVLSIDPTDIIDPSLIHVLWGMSKDFGANGLRFGAIISQHNPQFHLATFPGSMFSSISSLSEHITANILEDDVWVEKYIKDNQEKLAQHYERIATWAKQNDIDYASGANAGFFLWADLGTAYLRNHTVKAEDLDRVVMDALLQHKIFLASGARFGSEKPGWFRIIFSHQVDYLDEGLKRIVAAMEGPAITDDTSV